MLAVSKIYSQFEIGNELAIKLRQFSSLDFVAFESSAGSSSADNVIIDTAGQSSGYYDLVLESFDANSPV